MTDYWPTAKIMEELKLGRAGVHWLAKKRGWQPQYIKVGRSIGVAYLASDVETEIQRRNLKKARIDAKKA